MWFDREKSKELGETRSQRHWPPRPRQTALYEGIQAELHSFEASGLDVDRWSAVSPSFFTPGTHWKTRTQQQRRWLQHPVPMSWKSLPNHRAETNSEPPKFETGMRTALPSRMAIHNTGLALKDVSNTRTEIYVPILNSNAVPHPSNDWSRT